MAPHPNTRLSILALSVGMTFAVAAVDLSAQGTSGTSSGAASTGAGASTGKESVPAADRAFVQKAAIGGMAEVELGKLAQQKAANDQVKQFGARMVADHSKANDELKQIAGGKGIALPSDLDAKHKNTMAKLQKLSGPAFDRAYMDEMVADHKHDVSEFEKQSKSGRDSDLKAFAGKTLPTLQGHLKLAQSTHAAVKGGDKSSASAGAPAKPGG